MHSKSGISLTFLFHSVVFFILFWITKDNFFFWDKDIIDSIQAHWLLESNFNFQMPDSIDPGHLPLIPTILALLWKVLGQELIFGHFFIFFVTLAAIWQILRFVRFFIPTDKIFFASLIILLDTTFMAQSVLISGDLVLIFFFFLSVNSILHNQKVWHVIGLIGLCLISMRGLMSAAIIFFFHLYYLNYSSQKITLKQLLKLSYLYVIPLILPTLYYAWHFQQKGWVGYHSSSPWASSYDSVGIKSFFRNVIILGWRLVDFGRIFLWVFTVIFFIMKGKSMLQKRNPVFLLIGLFFISLFIYGLPILIYKDLAGHRYLLPAYMIFAVLCGHLLFRYIKKYQMLIYSFLLVGILSGSFWIYPEKIAQGWDSTLAHLPYYGLKKQFLEYLHEKNIKLHEVGAVTPNKSPIKYVHLNKDTSAFAPLNLSQNQYVFYSNIMNDYTDEVIDSLYNYWDRDSSFEKMGIFIKLFRNPKKE